MGLYINTNVTSLTAQRNLSKASGALGTSFQRLSSGLRINSAKDDAAGLAISNRFTAQIRGLNQAVRNTNDGISLAQTAEGAMQETTNILQRMRELSVQAANDTNTTADRESLQEEVNQLIDEVNRIAETTTFNNANILDGSYLGSRFHVGANARETINVTTTDSRANILGRQARVDSTAVDATDALAANDLVINNVSIRATQAVDDTVSTSLNSGSAIAKAAAINDSSAFTGVQAIVNSTEVTTATSITAATFDSANNIVINGETITGFQVTADDANNTLIDQINAASAETGVVAELDASNNITLTAMDGRNIEIEVNGNGSASGLTSGVTGGSLTLQSNSQVDLTLAANVGDSIGNVNGTTNAAGSSIMGVNSSFAVDTIDITTRIGANTAMEIVDVALGQISEMRSGLGAIQNRLESTISNLTTTSENLTASRSRILDADFADETAKLSKNQILQQAGISILAQANQQGQQALSLLG